MKRTPVLLRRKTTILDVLPLIVITALLIGLLCGLAKSYAKDAAPAGQIQFRKWFPDL